MLATGSSANEGGKLLGLGGGLFLADSTAAGAVGGAVFVLVACGIESGSFGVGGCGAGGGLAYGVLGADVVLHDE